MTGYARILIACLCALGIGSATAQDQVLVELIQTVFDDLIDPIFVVVAPDDDNVYIAAKDSILVYSRDFFGVIEPIQTIFDNANGVDGLNGVSFLTISPDGKFVYASGESESKVAVFERSAQDGALTFVQIVEQAEKGVDQLNTPMGSAISSDGAYLYVCARDDQAIAIFSRDSETGEITFEEGVDVEDPNSMQLSNPVRVIISPDDLHLYVVGDNGAITVYFRNTSTGALTFVQTLVAGTGSIPAFSIGEGIAISNDGNTVYSAAANFVVVFSRDSSTGSLTYLEHLAGSPNGLTAGLRDARSPVVSPADDRLYLVSTNLERGVVVFERFPPSGVLEPLQFINGNDLNNEGLIGATSLAVSQNGVNVYVVGDNEDLIATLRVDDDTSDLEFEGIVQDTANMVNGLNGAKAIDVSPDGEHLYVGGTSTVVTFDRDLGTGLIDQIDIEAFGDGSGASPLNVAAIDVSPDGKHVYALASANARINLFSRGEIDGFLTFVELIGAGTNGIPGAVFTNLSDGAVSPDNQHYYAKSLNHLVALTRNTTTGQLTHIASYENGVDGIENISGSSKISISPDGMSLYVTSDISNALTVFTRNETNGALTQLETQQLNAGDLLGLSNPRKAIVSPDGNHVYLIAQHASTGGALVLFTRNTATGALTFETAYLGQNFQEPDGIPGFIIPNDIAISPDSSFVFVAVNTGNGTVFAFARNPETGELRLIQTFEGDIQGYSVRNAFNLTLSPDSAYIHVTAQDADGIYSLERGVISVLEGIVYEQATGEEVGCGVIELSNADRSVVRTAVTDANGYYFFEELPFSVYTARVLSPGLGESSLEGIALTGGEFLVQDFLLPPGAATADINGTVTDGDTGEPLVGVFVEAFINDATVATTYTCSTGEYELDLEGVKGNTVDVTLEYSLENYDPVERDVVVTPGELLTVNQSLTKSIGFPGTLAGFVLDANASAIVDADVTIRGGTNASMTTDGQGAFSFTVPDGSYTIRASKNGYVGETASRSISGGQTALKTFSLEEEVEEPGDSSDVNNDGSTNSVDIQLVINTVLGLPTQGINADINGDNNTNSVDIQLVINAVLGV